MYRKICGDVGLHTIQTKQFKTARLSIYTIQPAHKENSPMATLLYGIFRRGSEAYPKLSLLNKRLDELYGTTLTLRNFLIGDKHILSFTAEMLEEDYLPDGDRCDILQGTMELLAEMLCHPLKDADGGLDPRIVEQEKVALCDSIRADINDPRTYASMRLRQIMCRDEPFGVSLSGDIEQIMEITPHQVTSFFETATKQATWEVYYTGRASAKRVEESFAKAFGTNANKPTAIPQTIPHYPPEHAGYVEESLPVEQGKLCMAWTKTTPRGEDHAAAVVLCELLGVMQSAILFRTVREEMGLCYYCDTAYEGGKGILTVASGIHSSHVQAAKQAILDVLSQIQGGELDPADVKLAQLSLQNAYRQIPESPAATEAYWFRHRAEGMDIPPDAMLEKLMAVTPEDVVTVAKAFKLDTVYFLKATAQESEVEI